MGEIGIRDSTDNGYRCSNQRIIQRRRETDDRRCNIVRIAHGVSTRNHNRIVLVSNGGFNHMPTWTGSSYLCLIIRIQR